jgi:UDP-glucose 4-epimerase
MSENFFIIGSDSFIAQKFIFFSKDVNIKGISRTIAKSSNEVVIPDFFSLSESHFKEIDVVINFAAIVHRSDLKDVKIYDEVNHKLTILNAQKAKLVGVKLFIQMSTIAVYGNTSEILITTPYNPQNPYGISKLEADEELLSLQDERFKVAIVRPPMVYGGGKAPGNMMRLIKLADRGIPLPFKGIDNRRDFINVHNLVQYISIIAEKQLSGIHLISDHEPVSTAYLLETIAKNLSKKDHLFKVPELGLSLLKKIRPNEFEKLFGTLQIETNFPYDDLIKRHTVEEGIREMVEWYKSNKA